MKRMVLVLLGAAVLSAWSIEAHSAEANKPPAKKKRRVPPAMAPVKDVAGLPRALLIGDSISIGYTVQTRKLLAGKVNLHRIGTNGGPTTRGLQLLDKWLGKGKWDVIHFNWGLHDLKYLRGRKRASPKSGKQQVPIAQYEKNLGALVVRLKKTGAKLIWATTTPVPAGAGGRVPGDAKKYNAVALKIMKTHGVTVNDLYGLTRPKLKTYQRPRNVHFTGAGSQAMARQVASSILRALGKLPPTTKPARKK